MAGFGKTDGPQDPDEDTIVIYLGRNLTDEQYNRVVKSIAASVYEQLPNVVHVGINSWLWI